MTVPISHGFGAGGAKSRAATLLVKLLRLCEPSQNGWFPECEQRQNDIVDRPPNPNAFPSWSTTSKSPSTRIGPLLMIVTFVDANESSVNFS